MITLSSSRLRVEISETGESPNSGYRFDRAGFISEVVLDGDMHFCASEPRNLSHPSSGGRGLCNEYKLDLSGQVAVGEFFPKLGVGLIRKEAEEPFIIYKKYKEVDLFPQSVEAGESRAVFHTQPLPCCGYAVRQTKTVCVQDNTLRMETELENVGEKPLHMEEFCHNFLSIDGMAINEDYTLEFPAIAPQNTGRKANRHGVFSSLYGKGRGYVFCEYSPQACGIPVALENASVAPTFQWILRNQGARANVTGTTSFWPQKVQIWYCDHIVSPEIFHRIEMEPGERCRWKRQWVFGRQ